MMRLPAEFGKSAGLESTLTANSSGEAWNFFAGFPVLAR
jgi:hypothetical protein